MSTGDPSSAPDAPKPLQRRVGFRIVLTLGPLSLYLIPESWVFSGPVFCLWRRFFDWECPGCGLLRAAHRLIHGRFAEATDLNPLVWVVAPILLLAYLRWVWKRRPNGG